MLAPDIKEYLARVGIRRINELDTALIEIFGQETGRRHIERLTELFDLSERRLACGAEDTPYLRRQRELVDYLNQSIQLSLAAASFYDRVFFRRAMEYLVNCGIFRVDEIFDIGCGNGILTCFIALMHPDSTVTGFDLSQNAAAVAGELAGRLQIKNVHFTALEPPRQKQCDTLFSCRTAQENVAWRPLWEYEKKAPLTINGAAELHEAYAQKLAGLVKSGGHLVSVERYEDDASYAGLLRALEKAGFCQVQGTHMQFSCKNGDGTGTFQAIVLEKNYTADRQNLQ